MLFYAYFHNLFFLFSPINAILILGVLMNKIVKTVLKKLTDNGYEAYVVGGYVRDLLLGNSSKDIDICTNAKVADLIALFPGKANEYGSLNFKVNSYNVDITTYRKENKYKNRKPIDFVYIRDLEKDLRRRDFTINTICLDQQKKVFDPLHGIEDLNKGILRAVGEAHIRIQEDPLRILRAIRFATVLDFTLDSTLQEAIFTHRHLVLNLSNYRIKEELSRILLSENVQKGLDLLKKFELDTLLGLTYTNVIYTKDLSGMWAQIDFPPQFLFTKNEKENIVKIRSILKYGAITNEILFTYGLYLSLVAGTILGIENKSIYKMHQKMPIHDRKDLKMSFLEIVELLRSKPSKKIKDIEQEILYEVLNGHIKNTYTAIKTYVLNNKERWNLT